MSELHFDASGEPVAVPASAEEGRVRWFRNTGMRGAPEVVHGRDGGALYVPLDASYLEFRDLVGGRPGRYRIDPVDDGRKVIGTATPLYVTITEQARNGNAAGGGGDDFMRELLRANVEMMRANVEMTKQVTDRLSYVMTSCAEIMRAADSAGLPQRQPVPLPAAPVEEEQDDEDDEDDEDEQEVATAGPLEAVIADLIERAAPHLVARMSAVVAPPTAPAAPVPTAAASPAAPAPAAAPPAAAPIAAPASAAPVAATPVAAAAPASVETPTPAVAPPIVPPPAPSAEVRNAPAPTPTPDQLAHLCAIDARLTPDESKIVRHAVKRLPPEHQAQWLAVLARMTVDEAVELVRAEMPPLRTRPGKERES